MIGDRYMNEKTKNILKDLKTKEELEIEKLKLEIELIQLQIRNNKINLW